MAAQRQNSALLSSALVFGGRSDPQFRAGAAPQTTKFWCIEGVAIATKTKFLFLYLPSLSRARARRRCRAGALSLAAAGRARVERAGGEPGAHTAHGNDHSHLTALVPRSIDAATDRISNAVKNRILIVLDCICFLRPRVGCGALPGEGELFN